MTEPALLVLDNDPDDGDGLRATLERRSGRSTWSFARARRPPLQRGLPSWQRRGRPVAIVAAPAEMIDAEGGTALSRRRRGPHRLDGEIAGPAWSAEYEREWSVAVGIVAAAMIEGAETAEAVPERATA